jgi:hypothetical protein
MGRKIKISEQELTQLINECVTRAINEISMDTLDSAIDKAGSRAYSGSRTGTYNTQAQRNKANQQYANLRKARAERMGYDPTNPKDANNPDNAYRQARWEKNNDERRDGRRRYENGKWSSGHETYSAERMRKNMEAMNKSFAPKKKTGLVDKLKGLVGKK